VVEVDGFPIISQWHIVYPRAKRLSPIAEAFKSHLLLNAVGAVRGKMWQTIVKSE
jgi:hypothetical protein